MPADTKRIAVEWLACADAVRAVRSQLSQLVHDSHVVARCWPECSVVLVECLNTARALEYLAGLLGEVIAQKLRKNMDVEELIALLAPCLHPPGSEAKIALLQARAEAGVELFQPGDSWRRRTS